jgi:hypothetical protein
VSELSTTEWVSIGWPVHRAKGAESASEPLLLYFHSPYLTTFLHLFTRRGIHFSVDDVIARFIVFESILLSVVGSFLGRTTPKVTLIILVSLPQTRPIMNAETLKLMPRRNSLMHVAWMACEWVASACAENAGQLSRMPRRGNGSGARVTG